MRYLVVAAIMLAAAPLAAQEEMFGNFYFVEDADPFSDANRNSIFVPNDDESVAFGVRCFDSGAAPLIITTDSQYRLRLLSTSDYAYVQYRFDSDEPSGRQRWSQQSDNPGALLARDGQRNDILRGLMYGSSVALRVWNDEEEHVFTTELDLDGARRAMSALGCVTISG